MTGQRLADRIVEHARAALEAGVAPAGAGDVTLVEVVQHLADELDADEGDVLRALAALVRDGRLEVQP